MNDKNASLLYSLYGIYAASIFLQFNTAGIVVSSIAVMIALFIASRQRKKLAGTIYESHHHWLVRTFWIGGAVYLPVMTVIAAIVMFSIAMPGLQALIAAGETDAQRIEAAIMAQSGGTMMMAGYGIFAPVSVWWLYRCWKGFRHLQKGEAVPKPESWL